MDDLEREIRSNRHSGKLTIPLLRLLSHFGPIMESGLRRRLLLKEP